MSSSASSDSAASGSRSGSAPSSAPKDKSSAASSAPEAAPHPQQAQAHDAPQSLESEKIKEKEREALPAPGQAPPSAAKSNSLSYIDLNGEQDLQLPECTPLTIAFSNLTYSVPAKGQRADVEMGTAAEPNRKFLLKGLNGVVKPGQMLCVLGPSGSGKTTLLDILARRVSSGKIGGSITLNGSALDDRVFRSIAKYVPQEDSLIGSFTVKETLMYAARFWLSIPEEEIEERVTRTIKTLGLEDASNTIIGTVFQKGISGGQKRRVSLAAELIANPSLLFLDEPTSGLDSAAAFHVMSILRRLCRSGRTVICTIHQPSSEVFHMSDNILLLSKGHQVYFGPSAAAADYFASLGYPCPPATNPADFLLNVLNTDFPSHGDLGKIVASYKSSASLQQIQTDVKGLSGLPHPTEQPKPNVFHEAWILMERGAKYILRNPGIYWVRLAMYVMLALMLGTLYLRMPYDADTIQDRISLLFFICAFMVFMSVAVLPQFLIDRPVFVRERANGSYGPLPYVLSQTLVSVPGIFLIAFITSVIVYWLCRLNPSGPRFGFFILDLFLALFVAEGLIHLISALVPFFIIGLVAAAGVYGGFMLTEGFFLIKSNIPPWWIWMYYIGFHTYSFESFMYNEFSGRTFKWDVGMRSAWAPRNASSDFVDGAEVLDLYEMNHDRRARDMGILLAMALIYRIGYYAALKFRHTGKR